MALGAAAARAATSATQAVLWAENGSCTSLRLAAHSLNRLHLATLIHHIERATLRHGATSVFVRLGGDLSAFSGSDLRELRRASPLDRAKHFQHIANLLHAVGDAPVPVVAAVDGDISGFGLGIASHARICVASERTRVAVPGPQHGFVPEAFSLHQLARLPATGVGAYMALTGAAMTGGELHRLGIATHITEAHTMLTLEEELGAQRKPSVPLLAQLVEDLCIRPEPEPLGEAHALYHAEAIEECFSQGSVQEILSALGRGRSAWHTQAKELLEASSPLALQLTFRALQNAAASLSWKLSLKEEAELCATAMDTADFESGFEHLQAARSCREDSLEELPVTPSWEHAHVDAVPEAMVDSFFSLRGDVSI